MYRHFVNSVEEAVELALCFKQEGRYDWFRGQVQAKWKPSSSMERAIKRGEKHESLVQRIMQFLSWAKTVPALSYLADPVNRDQAFAILQHYGFPTTYIDFTTEPGIAGFFASDCKEAPPAGTHSAIFCLNTADLRRFYGENMPSSNIDDPKQLQIDLVSVNVDNLWRLQAQAGHFLFANHSWYEFYDLDRIEFPWTGYPSFPPRSQIYPEHRSGLEQLLDNYFEEERRRLLRENFRRDQLERAASGQPVFKQITVSWSEVNDTAFVSPPANLPSWGAEFLKPWLEMPAESFHEVLGARQTVTLRSAVNAPLPCTQLAYGISAAMRHDPSLRRRAVQWELLGLPDAVNRERLEALVREAWNGMRRLPYADDDIAAACGALLELCAQPGCQSSDGGEIVDAFTAWRADAMEVEFGAKGDSGTRGFCSAERLRQAISSAWIDKLPSEMSAIQPNDAFRLCQMPSKMFDFLAFSKLFGRELIPSQLARGLSLIHFNPARLDVLGLP
ncbi:FRG domain-containing protein [Burkholderia pyrrocinia]|uniref:FRG domain-containing protein n=1 Tax=Burkholderia pyrrocinia TaxID=60550 RepID=UPI001576544F|nr:FRG domain-containing protein [Burkholderia pyrrocinia]